MEFVFKLIAGPAVAGAVWTAALNHEVGNDAVELEFVVKAFSGELHEVGTGFWRFIIKKFQLDSSA